MNKAVSYPIYNVNGYKFHTFQWAMGKKTNNTGVWVRGDTGSGQGDWYGVLHNILELEYFCQSTYKVILFKCDWFDPTPREGTRKHKDYNIIEVNNNKRYRHYDPFILPQNAHQVYYLHYPGTCKSNWMVVVKTKPRGRVECDGQETLEAYQVDDLTPSRLIVETGAPSTLISP